MDQVAALLASQKQFYERRAPDYGDLSKPDRKASDDAARRAVGQEVIGRLDAVDDALEIACGAGFFTRWLAPRARSLTALDSSAAMIERNRHEVANPRVTYLTADFFDWSPDQNYDLVFFGFWLSHVPPTLFDRFWSLVRLSLAPGGRVVFIDEDDRASGVVDDVRLVGGVPVARRALADGTQFDVVKVFWNASRLEERLTRLGWDISVTQVRDMLLCGEGQDALR